MSVLHSKSRLFAFTFALSFAFLVPASASAAGETPQQVAEARFAAGIKLLNQGKFEAARVEFAQAHAIYPRTSMLRNLALCELKTNRPLEAIEHLRAYLADPSSPVQGREYAKRNLENALAQTGHILVRANAGAAVSVDGQPRGAAPFAEAVDVLPGKHVLEARQDARVASREVEVSAGTIVESDLRFDEAPVATATVRAGEPAASTSPPIVHPEEPPSSGRWLLPAALGVGFLTGMGLGVGFGLAHSSTVDDAERLATNVTGGGVCADPASSTCSERREKLATASSQATISSVSYVVGGVFGVAAIVALVWPRPSKSGMALVPVVGPGSGGIHISRSF